LLADWHRTARGDFLRHSDGNAADLLDRQARALLLRHLHARPGDTLALLIDDLRIAQRGRKMAGLSKLGDHKEQRFRRGHRVVTAAIRYRGVVLPWRFAVGQPNVLAGRRYRQTTEIAAALIRLEFTPCGRLEFTPCGRCLTGEMKMPPLFGVARQGGRRREPWQAQHSPRPSDSDWTPSPAGGPAPSAIPDDAASSPKQGADTPRSLGG
jgi:hypothetical protein